jgi:hypothetical protein
MTVSPTPNNDLDSPSLGKRPLPGTGVSRAAQGVSQWCFDKQNCPDTEVVFGSFLVLACGASSICLHSGKAQGLLCTPIVLEDNLINIPGTDAVTVTSNKDQLITNWVRTLPPGEVN